MKIEEGTVRVFDTTLRDGEQTPGVSLTPEEKLEIAIKLDDLGVDTIEAGFPIVSAGELEATKLMVKQGLRASVCGLARARQEDIDAALDCEVPYVHVFIATSEIHMKHKLQMSREQVLEATTKWVDYTKDHGVIVEFSPEDATRTDPAFLSQILEAAESAGADIINMPDTVGTATPESMFQMISRAVSTVKIPISVHCHNDFGLAVANSLAGIRAGASQAHVTVNGLGERAGNASLEEFVVALHLLHKKKTGVNTRLLYETSRLVSRLTGVPVQPNKAIVGENAFGHESGIHTHGMLKSPLTYEPIDPELVGRRRWFQAGKHAGGHGLAAKLAEYGLHPTMEQMKEITRRVKEIGDKGKMVTDADLSAIATAVIGGVSEEKKVIDLKNITVVTGTALVPTCSVKIVVDGKEYIAAETGVGPVDAAIRAIHKIIGPLADVKLKEYRLEATTGGSDALAEVLIKVEDRDGNIVSARSAREDVVLASVEAMIEGINKTLIKSRVRAARD
ncbi:2-isopropylmalate synthase [Candidatus Bathyarchaeota archaeon]|nr:2-isopropylmalate synthase [Candidatus Bathyarchaeota archaeon]